MRLIVCDVGNAACAIVTAQNGNTIMIDCGSSIEKANPVDIFQKNKIWLGARDYINGNISHPLVLLHITHPDDDHVRNAHRVVHELKPFLVHRTRYENFSDANEINSAYVNEIDKVYRGPSQDIDLGFNVNIVEKIPVQICRTNDCLKQKERNNSSILRYIKDEGLGVLFCGDLEKPGWEYLINKNPSFVKMLKDNGVNVLIAPHHGHKSGFPKALFDAIGMVDVVILSKDSEATKEGTDVSTQYSEYSTGHSYRAYSDENLYYSKVLTTRSNGNIFISSNGRNFIIKTDKASPNHQKVM